MGVEIERLKSNAVTACQGNKVRQTEQEMDDMKQQLLAKDREIEEEVEKAKRENDVEKQRELEELRKQWENEKELQQEMMVRRLEAEREELDEAYHHEEMLERRRQKMALALGVQSMNGLATLVLGVLNKNPLAMVAAGQMLYSAYRVAAAGRRQDQ